jgi:hypothetical protein
MLLNSITVLLAFAIFVFHVALLVCLSALAGSHLPFRLRIALRRPLQILSVATILAGIVLASGFEVPRADSTGYLFCGLGTVLFLSPQILAFVSPPEASDLLSAPKPYVQ